MVEDDGGDRRGRADRRQTEAPVGVLPHRVVDAADDLGHLEDEPRHLRRHDVPVVPVRDRDERLRVLDAGLAQDVLVDAGADHRLAAEAGGESAESPTVRIDHRDRVARVVEQAGDPRSDSSAAHDDHSHRCIPDAGGGVGNRANDHHLAGRIEQHVVGRLAKRGPAMSAMDRRRHDDRVRVALDGLVDNRRADGAGLKQLGDDDRVSVRKRSPSRVLGVTQSLLACVNFGRQLSVQRHRLRNRDDEQERDRATVAAQEVGQHTEDPVVHLRTGNRHNQSRKPALHSIPLIRRAARTTAIGSDAEVWSDPDESATVVATRRTTQHAGVQWCRRLFEVVKRPGAVTCLAGNGWTSCKSMMTISTVK